MGQEGMPLSVAIFLGIVILFGASVFVKITDNFRFTLSISREIGIIFKILLDEKFHNKHGSD